jgi:hypothetical protein
VQVTALQTFSCWSPRSQRPADAAAPLPPSRRRPPPADGARSAAASCKRGDMLISLLLDDLEDDAVSALYQVRAWSACCGKASRFERRACTLAPQAGETAAWRRPCSLARVLRCA